MTGGWASIAPVTPRGNTYDGWDGREVGWEGRGGGEVKHASKVCVWRGCGWVSYPPNSSSVETESHSRL